MENSNNNTFKSISLKFTAVRKFICVVLYFLYTEFLSVFLFRGIYNALGATVDKQNLAMVLYEFITYIILFGIVFFVSFFDFKKEYEGFKSKKPSMLTLLLIGGFIIGMILEIVGSSISSIITGGLGTSENESAIDEMTFSNYGLLLTYIICFIGPLVEEIVFRQSLQKGLQMIKVHPIVAIIISGTVFGFLHVMDAGDYGQVITYLLLGYWLGYVYYISDNIYITMGIHVLINSFSMGYTYIFFIAQALRDIVMGSPEAAAVFSTVGEFIRCIL